MMPGETQPPPAGTAAAVPCKNCAVLQQNINEYVAALVALKQKMIHGELLTMCLNRKLSTDVLKPFQENFIPALRCEMLLELNTRICRDAVKCRLLTEYQQKCTELQFAEREISALRCQVEQMLQKILPLEKDQKELGSLKAELEEKKSSLKIYQESQLECVRLKEEIVRSDAVRKKLEAKVKKLEEAATKHTQDFKQLKIEKKKLEKELKKAQGKLDGVPKEKCRKAVKHAETQSTNEVLAADIDKEKIKFLLEELWMCIDSAKEKGEKQENDPILVSAQDKAWPGKRRLSVTKETVQTHQKNGKHGGKTLPWHSSIESAGKQNSVTALQQVDTEPLGSDCLENRTTEDYLQGCEDKTRDVIVQRDGTHNSSALSDQEQKGQGGNVMDILNWVRPLPALLSPVRLSPVATQDTLFGELTGSSDEEMDCIASAEECILQEDQVQSQNCCNVFKQNEECNRWNKPRGHSLDTEISCNLSRTEKIVHISPATLIKEERNTKQCEVATLVTNIESNRDCLENSENMEAAKRDLMEARACELEAEEEQKGDIKEMHKEEKASSIHSMLHSFNLQNQIERSSEVEQTEENAILVRAGGYNSAHENYGELMKTEHEREIPKAVTIPQNVTNLPPEQYHVVLQRKDSEEKSGMLIESEVVENECKDAIKITSTAINVEENIKQVVSGEEATATIQTQGLCAEPNNGRELSENVLCNFSSSKSSCEAKCPEDLIIQYDGEGIVMETDICTESTVHSQCSEIRHDSEKILEEQCKHTLKCEIVRKCELETPEVSQCYSPVSAVEGVEQSLYMDDTDKKACVVGSASLAFPEDDGQLKIQDKNIIRPKSVDQTMKLNKESVVLEIGESSELLHNAENGKLLYEKEREGLEGKNHQEESFSHFFQGKSDLESIPAVPKMACVTDAESSIAKCESFVLDSTERNGEINQPENLCSTIECELSKTQNFGVIESQESEFKVNQEDFIGDSNKLLEKVDTIQSVLVESNLTSQTQFAEPQNQFLMTTDAKCDETKAELNKQNKELIEACPSSFKEEKNVVKKNNVSEIIQEPSSEMDFNSGFALCSQMDLKTDCINSKETGSPIQVRNGLESTVPSGLNFSPQKVVRVGETDFTKNSDFSPTWKKKGDKNCIVSSAFNCSLEGFKKGAEVTSTEKDNMCKEHDVPCSEKYIHKNEGGVPGEKELPIDKVPETSVELQILHADSHKKSTLTLQNIICQESECKTSTWETRTDSSRTCSITAGEESKGLNRLEAPEENSIERSENAFDVAEQSNESKEKDCPLQKVQCVKCSEHVAKLRKELRASTRIVVDALETGAIVDAGDQLCELHSTTQSGNTATGSHLKPDAGMDMDIHCERGSSPNAASEKSGEVEEGYPKDYSTLKRRCTLLASENTDGASEFRIDNSTTGWMNDSREDLLETGTSKGSPVMLSASKSRLPLCQMLTTFSEAYKIAVKHSKLNTRMLALGNVIEENYSEKFESNVQQKLPHSVDMDISIFEEYNHDRNCSACNSGEHNANLMLDGLQPSCCFSGTTWKGFLDNGRKNFIVKYFANPALSDIDCNSQMVNQAPKPQKAAFEDSCMLESESCVDVALKKTNTLKCKGQEQSEVLSVSTKAAVQVVHGRLSKKLFQGKSKTNALEVKVTEPVLANADTSMPTKSLSETINKIRQEMGPPLPPLLLPLIATPPRATTCSMGPVMSSADRSSLLSPLDELISPLRESPVPPLMSPLTDTPTVKSALLFSSPSPSEMAVGKRILSSPLQFCTSIPKHALPVPGRLPLCATDGAATGAPQENSVKILDTMYPELSARARTLNILKGNIQLNLCALSDSQSSPGPVAQIGSFKTIASTSTAFVKTGSNLKSDGSKDQDTNVKNQQLISSSSSHLEKRTSLPVPMPRSAKRLRLDSEPPKLEPTGIAVIGNDQNMDSEIEENSGDKSCEISDSAHGSSLETSFPVKQIVDPDCQKVDLALKKIAESCFDLLPVIQSHLGNISKIPIMRDEEKEVVNEFGIKNRHLAESLLHVILNKLKAQKVASTYSFNQALCRVYTGVCRQLGDLERARLFCYSLLKEDFPDSVKLIIFITNIWPDIFFFQGAINKAMQLIIRQNANDSVLACLNACLSWEQGSSSDAGIMVSNLLLEMQSCPKVEFQLNEQYGEDLSDDAWQYIFAIDLLCCHLKWDWTHDNVISKVLWPSMDKWIKKRKDRETAQSVPDSIIALTLRLIGRLGQIGLKEGYLSAVKNISSVIGLFVQHAKEEDVPWGVQLAAIYSLCDLGSSNPSGIVGAIHAWRATVLNSIPFAVTRGLAEVSSLCKMDLP